MGRVGEVSLRCWQTAHKMKVQQGSLPGDSAGNDNARVEALPQSSPSTRAGPAASAEVGSIEVGKVG